MTKLESSSLPFVGWYQSATNVGDYTVAVSCSSPVPAMELESVAIIIFWIRPLSGSPTFPRLAFGGGNNKLHAIASYHHC